MATNKKKIFVTQTMSPGARALLTERESLPGSVSNEACKLYTQAQGGALVSLHERGTATARHPISAGGRPMDHRPSVELLESTHLFPGTYQIKAIGSNDADFAGRVVAAAISELSGPSEVEHTIRHTQGGRHIAVPLPLSVHSAEQVLAIYAALKQVEGLALLL